jgi:hypothetical protein
MLVFDFAPYAEDDPRYNMSMDEYYVDAMQEAFELLGEHREMITMVESQLNLVSKENVDRWKNLSKLLLATDNVIEQNTEVLREKFGSELSYSKSRIHF